MTADRGDCQECREVEALDRLLAAVGAIEAIIWQGADPQRGIAAAGVALRNARDYFHTAGYRVDDQ